MHLIEYSVKSKYKGGKQGMKRMMKLCGVIGMVLLMIGLLAVPAAAQPGTFSLDLYCTDNPGGPTGAAWQVDWSNTTPYFSGFVLYFDSTDPAAVLTITLLGFWGFAMTAPGPGVAPLLFSSTASPGSTWSVATFGAPWFTINSDRPTNLSWYDDGAVGDPGNFGLVLTDNVATPLPGAPFGFGTLDGAGSLNPPNSTPTPPIPEIITIVLISIGLISLGAYVWFRRRRQNVELTAA